MRRTGNHEYVVTISGATFKQIILQAVLPQAFVDEARLQLNPLATRLILDLLRRKVGPQHPLAQVANSDVSSVNFFIKQPNV